jgi:signal transduction histidine kinase/ligand-binding sensor domain-containing protein
MSMCSCVRQRILLPVFLAAVAVALPRLVAAQDRAALAGYSYSSWSLREGLPGREVWGFSQSADGRLWLATYVGVVRFDGYRFAFQPMRSKIPTSEDRTQSVCTARDGSVWVGFNNRVVSRLLNGTVTTFRVPNMAGASNLVEDPQDGSIWGASIDGLFRFDGALWRRLDVPTGTVWGLFFDRSGNLWVASSQGVFRKDAGTGTLFTLVDTHSSSIVTRFVEDPEGRIALTNTGGGFRTVFPKNATSRAESAGITAGVWDAKFDALGNLWVGTRGSGVALVHPDGRVEYALQGNSVTSVFEDRDRNIWLGTLDGIHRFSAHMVRPLVLSELTFGVAADHEGRTWVATSNGVKMYQGPDSTGPNGLEHALVNSIDADRTGQIWAATYDAVFRLENATFKPAIIDRRLTRITALGTDSRGTLWISDSIGGLFSWERGVLHKYGAIPGFVSAGSQTMFVDRHDRVWLKLENGRIGFVDAARTFHEVDIPAESPLGTVETFLEASNGDVWIGGRRGFGVFRNSHLLTVGDRNGFLWGAVFGIVQADDGALWFSTTDGLVRVAVGDLNQLLHGGVSPISYSLFTAEDGMAGPSINRQGTPNCALDTEGRLWFVTGYGVTVVDPRSIGSGPRTPVAIDGVVGDGDVYSNLNDLQLPSGTNHIEIRYSALQMRSPGAVHFVYKLDAFNEQWVDGGSSRQAAYTKLRPGQYTFRVAALGTGAPSFATVTFSVAPKLYQTPWFSIVIVSIVVAIGWLLRHNHLGQLRRQSALVWTERTRISQEIHDTLLQSLAGVAMQLESLSLSEGASVELPYLRRHIEDDIREARDTIMQLRTNGLKSVVEGGEFIDTLREMARRTTAGTGMDFTMAADRFTDPIDTPVARQVFRVAQEAMSNAARHSGARHLVVGTEQRNGHLSLSVADDGSGFEMSGAEHVRTGYGLIIMRERVEQVGGTFTIVSARGHGTTVSVSVPIVRRRRAKEVADL